MPLRLKSLELHGYKTFANRSLFEFADTVTAIVGPNGSGKSNIADSLRWVLGEQSYSLLRGKKTEDMIFAGSESRPRAGMASAMITFDNADGWLPIDFSEVAIARRAYRDGLNEYQVNGQRVRLKDVSELLAHSGLAERTYTVIGQGLVDAALSLKADERRRLFEEAAGIGLHRSRREEALRRLETTRRNLERVEDILAELKPRLHSLERQARRSIEYEQLRADLHLLLREWYGYHWQLTQQELAEAGRAAEVQDRRLDNARRDVAVIEGETAALRQNLLARRTELSAWHKELAVLQQRREAVSRELAVLTERREAFVGQETALDAEAARLEEELGLAFEALGAVDREITERDQELEETRRQRDLTRSDLSARQAERATVEALIAGLRQEIGQLNARLGRLQAHRLEQAAAVERAQKALITAEESGAKAAREHQAAAARYQAAREGSRQANTAFKAAEGALQRLRSELEAIEDERRKTDELRTAGLADLAGLQARAEVLEQAEAALSGYASGTQALLLAARQGDLSGARGVLAGFLEAPPELEKAIVAALGEFIDAVVLDDDPSAALDLLRDHPGRGVLLPAPLLKPAPRLAWEDQDDAGVLGVASELVACASDFQAAINLLLGSVLVVRDRGTARRIAAQLPPGSRVVTASGEVFCAGGAVIGGGSADSGPYNLLARRRQQGELASERQRLEGELAALQERLRTQVARLGELRQEGVQLSRQLDEARRAAQTAARAEDQAQAALQAAERQSAWAADQQTRLQAELARSRSEIKKLTAEEAEVDAGLAQARQSIRSEAVRLEALALDERQTQLAHWETRLAVAERAQADARLRSTERRERRLRLEKSAAALSARRVELEAARRNNGARLEQLRSDNNAIAGQVQAVSARIDPAEATVEGMESESGRLQKIETEARQSLSIAEHAHAQARINLARRQESLASLQRRIEEDFGLVAFEYEEKVSGPTPLPLTGLVEELPLVKKLAPETEENIKRQRAQLRRLGAVNPEAQTEFREVKERYEFLTSQVADLHQAEEDVREVIDELDGIMQREFRRTFDAVAEEFHQIFTRLFGGGSARLLLTDPDDLTQTGIDIQARLPGRRAQGLALLSGGERSLTAVALVFALLKVSPTPFCVLDEVDAMLDEVNVSRFRELLRELAATTQFIIITHNRNTVQAADVIYGITMGRDSSSQVLSLRLDEIGKVVD